MTKRRRGINTDRLDQFVAERAKSAADAQYAYANGLMNLLRKVFPGESLYWAGVVWLLAMGGLVVGASFADDDVAFGLVVVMAVIGSVVVMLLRIRGLRRGPTGSG